MKAYMLSDYERRHLAVLDRIATALESISNCMVGEEYVEPPEEMEVNDDDSVQMQSETEYEVL